MLDFVVLSMLLNRKKQSRQESYLLKDTPTPKETSQTHCEYCGQYLPWFCVCYLNWDKRKETLRIQK